MSSLDLTCNCRQICPVAPSGHITITNYLLNYYPGLDIERRNCHGFTALMKAAMQGRVECVRALMMAGEGERQQRTSQYWYLELWNNLVFSVCVFCLIPLYRCPPGAALNARDFGRNLTARDWALFTCRYETAWMMTRLMERPCPSQYCEAYR